MQHTPLAKFIHWTFIPLYVYGIVKQVNDISELEDSGLLILEVIFATVFLLIVVLRFTYMRRFKTFQGAKEHVHIVHYYFARIVHRAMYACLILLPLTGLIIAGLYNQGYTNEEQTILDLVLEMLLCLCLLEPTLPLALQEPEQEPLSPLVKGFLF